MGVLGRDQETISAVLDEEFRQDEEDKEEWQRERGSQSAETEAGFSADAVAEAFLGTEDSASDTPRRGPSPRRPHDPAFSSSD